MIRMVMLAGGLLAAGVVLSGCASMKIEDYRTGRPPLVLEQFFNGRTVAAGLFEDRFGKVRRQFVVTIDGRLEPDGTLVLDEDFTYNDGEKQRRIWRLKQVSPGVYEGRASDVPGVAKGRLMGNSFNFQYEVDLKVGDGTWRVRFDDWMFLQPNGTILNRAWVYRWGFEIGSVTLSFPPAQPLPQAAAAPAS
jgi:hypothetical protein